MQISKNRVSGEKRRYSAGHDYQRTSANVVKHPFKGKKNPFGRLVLTGIETVSASRPLSEYSRVANHTIIGGLGPR